MALGTRKLLADALEHRPSGGSSSAAKIKREEREIRKRGVGEKPERALQSRGTEKAEGDSLGVAWQSIETQSYEGEGPMMMFPVTERGGEREGTRHLGTR